MEDPDPRPCSVNTWLGSVSGRRLVTSSLLLVHSKRKVDRPNVDSTGTSSADGVSATQTGKDPG